MEVDWLAQLTVLEGEAPAYQQIAAAISARIRDGSLPPGERLPADRRLAQQLGVSRTTVVSAYEELKSAGLVRGRQGSGTYVARTFGPADGVWSSVDAARSATSTADRTITLTHSLPPNECVPLLTLLRFMTEAAEDHPAVLTDLLPAEGLPSLRHELARQLQRWAMAARPEEILVLSGSQQGIDLLARLYLQPGDYVAVEAHTYGGALASFRAAGARLVPVPYDGDGMDIDALASVLARYPVRFIYTMPTFHNPSSATMPLARRQALLRVASHHAAPIIEDNPFEHIYFDQPPPSSLWSLDRDGLVRALGSASKILGTGLRLGWLVAPAHTIEQVARLKRAADLHASTFAQVALERFLAAGLMDHHLAALRAACFQRSRRLMLSLGEHLPEVAVDPPRGGLVSWFRLPGGLSGEAVLHEAMARGVAFMPGSWFSVNHADDGFVRLCFAHPPSHQLDDAVRRLALAVRAVGNRRDLIAAPSLPNHLPLI